MVSNCEDCGKNPGRRCEPRGSLRAVALSLSSPSLWGLPLLHPTSAGSVCPPACSPHFTVIHIWSWGPPIWLSGHVSTWTTGELTLRDHTR